MKTVLIIEAQMKQYRAPFYEHLHRLLREEGIHLKVAYSDPIEAELAKKDNCDLPAEYGIKVKSYWIKSGRLLFQPLFDEISGADLVIIDLANKFILNHFLLLISRLKLKRVAFWGLGENKQANRSEFSEWYKKHTLNWVTWWFAYTEGTARYLEAHGVPTSKITVVHNSVDTREIRKSVRSLTAQERAALREQLGIPETARVGIFCGMLEKVKGLPFLVESCRIIRVRIPDFHLILVGGGPEQDASRRLIAGLDWVHWVGPRFGRDKAELLAIADAFLLPGRVGLAVLDAFAAGLPMLTTRLKIHGPEAEYLEDGVNGLMSDPDPVVFAETVSSLFCQSDSLARLRVGALSSAEKYSIENMAVKFRSGIRSCLGLSGACISVLDRGPRVAEHAREAHHNCNRFVMTTSWDDGHPLDFRVAELLAKYGLSGTFYIPFANSRPTLSLAQVRDLSFEFEIGAHTVHHLVLTSLPNDLARTEIEESKRRLEEITGKPCPVFCPPSGRYAAAHLKMLGDAGFSAARTVELLSLDRPRVRDKLAIIPTTIQVYPHSAVTYFRNAVKRHRSQALCNLLLCNQERDWAATAIALLERVCEKGGVFHLWGHSWEIEETGQWQALDRVFAAMAGAKHSAACLTNSELCFDAQ